MGMLKAANVFDDMELIVTEFTPRDVYMLKIYDENYVKPDKCKNVDPSLPYC